MFWWFFNKVFFWIVSKALTRLLWSVFDPLKHDCYGEIGNFNYVYSIVWTVLQHFYRLAVNNAMYEYGWPFPTH